MSAILSIGKINPDSTNLLSEKTNEIQRTATAIKIVQVATAILATLTTIASYISYSAIKTHPYLMIPFQGIGLSLVLGGLTLYLAKYAYDMPNYSNPENIERYKKVALKDSLTETFTKHQPSHVKLFDILDKETFDAKLHAELAEMDTVAKMEKHLYKIDNVTHGFFGNILEVGLKKHMQSSFQDKCHSKTLGELIEKNDFIAFVEWDAIPEKTIKANEKQYKLELSKYKNTNPTLYPRLHQEIMKYKGTIRSLYPEVHQEIQEHKDKIRSLYPETYKEIEKHKVT